MALNAKLQGYDSELQDDNMALNAKLKKMVGLTAETKKRWWL